MRQQNYGQDPTYEQSYGQNRMNNHVTSSLKLLTEFKIIVKNNPQVHVPFCYVQYMKRADYVYKFFSKKGWNLRYHFLVEKLAGWEWECKKQQLN